MVFIMFYFWCIGILYHKQIFKRKMHCHFKLIFWYGPKCSSNIIEYNITDNACAFEDFSKLRYKFRDERTESQTMYVPVVRWQISFSFLWVGHFIEQFLGGDVTTFHSRRVLASHSPIPVAHRRWFAASLPRVLLRPRALAAPRDDR